jgi:hypothetical protein
MYICDSWKSGDISFKYQNFFGYLN